MRRFCHNDNAKTPQDALEPYRKITNYAIICIAFLICVFNPYALYVTDITQFDSTQTIATLSALFGAFLAVSFIAIYLISFIPKKFAKIPAFIFSLVLFIGLIYSFILVGDYGAMDHFILQKPPENTPRQILNFIAVLAVGAIFIAFVLKRLLYLWQIIFITLFIVSGVNATNIIVKRVDSAKIIESRVNSSIVSETQRVASETKQKSGLRSHEREDKTDSLSPKRVASLHDLSPQDEFAPPHLPYAKSSLFSYSKSHKNIVVIVLDMFSGSHTPHILAQFPHLRKQLDGFTLFPNALSTTDSTIHSVATLIGGEHYAVYNVNARGVNLANEIESAFQSTANAFANSDYEVAFIAYTGRKIQNLIAPNIFAIDSSSEIFVPYYGANLGILERIYRAKERNNRYVIGQLIGFGVFRFAPNIFAKYIYNDANWLFPADWYLSKILLSIQNSADFYAITHNASADSPKPTFKFFHSMITHLPFGAYFQNGKCEFGGKWSAWMDYPHKAQMHYPKFKHELNFFQHYDLEACALHYLAHFVEMLKNLGIYDNTQIIVVSDHAGNDGINMPTFDDDFRPDALFLFKDFGAKGAIRTDKRLMANYDIATIFCANLKGGCPNVGQNILQNYPANREIIFTIPSSWQLEHHKANEWLLKKAYKVHSDIHNAKNWSEFDEIVNVK